MSKKGKRLLEFEKNNRSYAFAENSERRAKRSSSVSSKKNKENIEDVETKEFKKERKKKKLKIVNMKRFIASVIVVILIAFVGMSAINIIQLTIERNKLQEENEGLIKEKEDLTTEMEYINSDEYIEQQARKELKLIKENEILFIVEGDEDKE